MEGWWLGVWCLVGGWSKERVKGLIDAGGVLFERSRGKSRGCSRRQEGVNGQYERNSVRLTSFFDIVPHLPNLSLLDLGCGGIEAAYFVVLLVGEDGAWEG